MSELLDTNLLINWLRDRSDAVTYVRSLRTRPYTSTIVVAELFQGVRDGPERIKLEALVTSMRVILLDRELAVRAGLIARQYGPSHGTSLADPAIAATVEMLGATLVTLNTKHFPMLASVHRPY